MKTKHDIRRMITHTRRTFQPLGRRSASVVLNIQCLDAFQQATAVGTYIPLPGEVDVSPLLKQKDKTFYIPAFDKDIGKYRMARYTPELTPGKFGIPEPKTPVWAGREDLEMILVPGVAFDRTGNRLGRGGGFYDRLLPQYSAERAGVCLNIEIIQHVPTEPHDSPMHWLISESEILEIEMNS